MNTQDKETTHKETPQDKETPPVRKRSLLGRIFKWAGVILTLIIVLILVAVSLIIWTLTPERLTPLVEKYGSDYIEGEIKARRIELTFWSSFPRLIVEAQGLTIVSHAFDRLSQEERNLLPLDADTLLSIGRFSGGINLPLAARGKIALYDIKADSVRANIVQYSQAVANYNLLPPDEKKEESDILPDIEVDHFALRGETRCDYFSLPDSTDVTIRLRQTSIAGEETVYRLNIDGTGTAELANHKWFDNLHFGIDGRVKWTPRIPDIIGLENMAVTVGKATISLDALLDFTEALTLKEFSMKATSLKVADVIDIIPPLYAGELNKVETDLALDLKVGLEGPFRPLVDEWPTANIDLTIPGGTLKYDRMSLNKVEASLTARLDGKDPDASTIDVERLTLIGRSMALTLSGHATSLMTDPSIDVRLHGGADFSRLPSILLKRLPFTFSGRFTGDTRVRMRQSYLDRKEFHRIKADGTFDLRDFNIDMRDSSLSAFANHANFRFGTSAKIKLADNTTADSLLTARLTIDTTSVKADGISLTGKELLAGVGIKNVATSLDTTQINPIGFNIRGERITIISPADSMRLRLRQPQIKGSLTRYESHGRRPLLRFNLTAGRIGYRDPYNRVFVRDAVATFKAHTKRRPTMSRSVGEAYDSLIVLYPDLRRDSVLSLARAEVRVARRRNGDTIRARRTSEEHEHDIDMLADGSIRSLLKWWEASGTLKAERGSLFTPYFPLRNRISKLDMDFNTDSITIRDTKYRLGNSDFLINGLITNISRAVTSRRGAPLKAEFDIQSDTLNINQIAQAAFAGSAFAEKVAKGAQINIKDTDNDAELQKSIEANADLNDKLAFIVPSNIEATLRLKAANVLYADIWAQRLTGDVSVANGRINLHRFSAFTDLGSLDLTALYTAPTMKDLGFAGGMVIRNLDLKRFLHMLPEIDSLMPLLRDVEGIITADIAMTTELDSLMDLKFHTLNLAMKLHGDSLVLLDTKTFRTACKWLRFKRKDHNMIDSMSVELAIHDSRLDLYPFMFNFDRYKLGVSGGNTFNGDYDYHVAVLKSPLPFRFGINIKGHGDKLRIRLGRARFNENAVSSSRGLTDTLRINLLHEIESVFKFGVSNGRRKQLILTQPKITPREFAEGDSFSREDSLLMIKEGVIEAPSGYLESIEAEKEAAKPKKKRKRFLGIF